MLRRYFAGPVAAVLAAALIPLSVADAARIDAISVKEERLVNGERVKSDAMAGRPGEKATGDGIVELSSIIELNPLPDALQPDEVLHLFEADHEYRIVPEAGEVEGQCVLVDWTYEASSSLEVTGLADGVIAVGGYTANGDTEPRPLFSAGPARLHCPRPREVHRPNSAMVPRRSVCPIRIFPLKGVAVSSRGLATMYG